MPPRLAHRADHDACCSPHSRPRSLTLLVAAPGALADAFTPESGGSPNADDIDTLYKITLYVAIVIFIVVEGTLIWSLVKYRARRGGPRRPRSAATRRSSWAGRSARR